MDYKMSEIDLSKLVVSVIRELEYWIREKKFTLKQSIDKGIIINADSDAITQAIFNLISNAIKYSIDRKEINLILYENSNEIILEVIDRGIGIEQKELFNIFEKYYRVSDSKIRGSQGTGLGLTVTRSILKAHNGYITVDSKPGEGSTFALHFPNNSIYYDKKQDSDNRG